MTLRSLIVVFARFQGMAALFLPWHASAQGDVYFNPPPDIVWQHNGPDVSENFDEAAFAAVLGPADALYTAAANTSTDDGLVSRFDAVTGDPVWSTPWPGVETPCAIALVGADKVLCLGRRSSILTLLMLTTDGDVVWSLDYEAIGELATSAPDPVMAVGANGAILVSAATGEYMDSDVTTMRIDLQGGVVWQESYSSTGLQYDAPHDITIDGEGNVIVVGTTTQNGADVLDHLLLKYTPDGDLAWTWTNEITGQDRLTAVVTDAANNIYAAGFGFYTGFLVALEPTGDLIWARQPAENVGVDYSWPAHIALDQEGNIVASFGFGMEGRLCKYAPEGTEQWTLPACEKILDLVIGPDDQILVSGMRPYFSAGMPAWIESYRPTGQMLWRHALHGGGGWSQNYRGSWPLLLTARNGLITAGDNLGQPHIRKICIPPMLNCMELALACPIPDGENVIAGYFDADQDLDLAKWMFGSSLQLLAGNNDGTFTSTGHVYTERFWRYHKPFRVLPTGPMGTIGFFADPADTTVQLFAPDGSGSFDALPMLHVDSAYVEVEVADLDEDLGDDLVIRYQWPVSGVRILLNDGSGTLQPHGNVVLNVTVRDVGLADLTGDGHVDLVVSYQASPMEIRAGDGSGGFLAPQPITTITMGGMINFGDVDLDGYTDLITAHYGPPKLVTYLHEGSGVGPGAEQAVPVDPRGGVMLFPFLPSQRIPYLVAAPVSHPSLVYPGDSCSTTGWGSSHLSWDGGLPLVGDFNGDGRPDIGQHRSGNGDDFFMLWLNCGSEDLTTAVPEDVINAHGDQASCWPIRSAGSRILFADNALIERGVRVEIFDLRGALVHGAHWNATSTVDLGQLDPGIYVVRASGTIGTCVSKIFIE